MVFAKNCTTVKEIDYSSSKFDNIDIANPDDIRFIQMKLVKLKNFLQSKKPGISFFIFRARLVFIKLKQAFVKAPILYHFDLEYHI